MRSKLTACIAGLLVTICAVQPAHAQLMKKLKDKLNQAAGNAAEKKVAEEAGLPADNSQSTSNSPSGSPTNKGGAGLKNTAPPDVNQQMDDAIKSNTAKSYSDARYSLQQAMVGIEIQIGREVLKSLPATVDGLTKDTTKNVVTSLHWGWNNLTIQTVYSKAPDKQMTVTIGNNAFYSGFVNMYFNNAAMVQADQNNQNIKQTKVKGYKAMIQYDDSKGYSLLVPIGQTSMIVWEDINFANEDEVMSAANAFDIDGIKKMLGEQ